MYVCVCMCLCMYMYQCVWAKTGKWTPGVGRRGETGRGEGERGGGGGGGGGGGSKENNLECSRSHKEDKSNINNT